jgi:hypothetical protein
MTPLFVMLLSTVLIAGAAHGGGHWHDDDTHFKQHAMHQDDGDRDVDHRANGCYFRPGDARQIGEYYAPRYRALPPGLQKKPMRRGRLPPGWARRIEPLPPVLEPQLIVLPPEYRRGVVDGQVVVYNPHADILIDVVDLFGLR